jgi:hypothetical protein
VVDLGLVIWCARELGIIGEQRQPEFLGQR